jgi:hypothetical protein
MLSRVTHLLQLYALGTYHERPQREPLRSSETLSFSVIAVAAQRLELDQVDMHWVGVLSEVEEPLDLRRSVGHKPIDRVLEVPGDHPIRRRDAVVIRHTDERLLWRRPVYWSQFEEQRHAVLFDQRHHPPQRHSSPS